jgi:lipoprotein-anchoring transpeptidase ErfK/SrfK
VALVVTLVTLLGGLGLLPEGDRSARATDGAGSVARLTTVRLPQVVPSGSTSPAPAPAAQATGTPTVEPAQPSQPAQPAQPPEAVATLPPGSGTGPRVVFDIGDQRVWLVDPATGRPDGVVRTYLASGSVTDNLDPGTYEVYSRSRWAVGIDDSGAMEYFVRFTRGENAAIGFHSIPEKAGRPLQSAAQLGTPQSHGCIRQALPDARRLWTFAPVGTKVVVTA